MCTRSPEARLYPGLHQEKRVQQVEGGDSAPLLHSGDTSPGVLCPALESSAQEKHGAAGVGAEEATKVIRGLEHLSCEEVGALPEGAYKKAGEGLFTRACSDRTRGNGFKLKEGRFRLDIRKKFFTVKVVRHWHRFPREAVAASSLAVFKARLDGALSSLVWWKVSLPMAGGLEPDDL